ARILEQKNQMGLIEAFHKSEMCNNSILYFIGNSTRNDYVDDLDNYIHANHLNDRVFITGAKENIEEYYQASDLFVLFSNFEGSPNALVEAMSCGLPVLCSDV